MERPCNAGRPKTAHAAARNDVREKLAAGCIGVRQWTLPVSHTDKHCLRDVDVAEGCRRVLPKELVHLVDDGMRRGPVSKLRTPPSVPDWECRRDTRERN